MSFVYSYSGTTTPSDTITSPRNVSGQAREKGANRGRTTGGGEDGEDGESLTTSETGTGHETKSDGHRVLVPTFVLNGTFTSERTGKSKEGRHHVEEPDKDLDRRTWVPVGVRAEVESHSQHKTVQSLMRFPKPPFIPHVFLAYLFHL